MPLIIVRQAGGSSLRRLAQSHGSMGWRWSERRRGYACMCTLTQWGSLSHDCVGWVSDWVRKPSNNQIKMPVCSEWADLGAYLLDQQCCWDIAPERQKKAAQCVSNNLGITGAYSSDAQVSSHNPSHFMSRPLWLLSSSPFFISL